MLSLLFLVAPALAANCGTSTIPFSFEVLPDGSTSLGCARPTCFGWDGSGDWASQDHSFSEVNGRPDGFLRPVVQHRPAFNSAHPSVISQTVANCLPSASCQLDQWVGGIFAPEGAAPSSMICCSHDALMAAESQGIATVKQGQIVIGGEVEEDGSPTHFDYIRNIQQNDEGKGYSVELARMTCRDPPALVQNQEPVVASQQEVIPPSPPVEPAAPPAPAAGAEAAAAPAAGAPSGGAAPSGGSPYYYNVITQNWYCFAADSTVTLADGTERRMDELQISDYVQVPTDDMKSVVIKPVRSWLHKMPKENAEFLVIKSETGKHIKITARHFIFKGDCDAETSGSMVTADEIQVGDCLFQSNAEDTLSMIKVTDIRKVKQQGIYAPLTTGGKIMVDGIAVSCHSEVAHNRIVQTLHKNFVHCDTDELTCVLKESFLSLAMDITRLVFPISS